MTESTTRASVLKGPRRVHIDTVELPPLAPDEVRLTDLIGGVCGTDTAKWNGVESVDAPIRLGHEFGGIVESVGASVKDWKPGDTVAAWIKPGWPYGGIAERTIVKASWLVRMKRRELACFVEPFMCVALAVLRTRPPNGPLGFTEPSPLASHGYRPRLQRDIAVIGTGTMALGAVAMSALENPARVIVVGRSQESLDRAMALGATRVINSGGLTREEVIEEIKRSTPAGRGVDVAYEGIGEQWAIDVALASLRMGGTMSPLGFHQSPLLDLHPSLGGSRLIDWGHHLGWWALGVTAGHSRDAETAQLPPEEDEIMPGCRFVADLLDRGMIDPSRLVGDTWPLADTRDALIAASGRGAGKQVIDSTLV